METGSKLRVGWWTLFGLALIAGVLWMLAIISWERPTLYVTAASGLYSFAALSWWRAALLSRLWVQVVSALPLTIAAGGLVALVAWVLSTII
jgi:hypothetical protein